MKLTVIGSGDAFSSGARLQASFLLDAGQGPIMLDCGATTLVGLERMNLKLDDVPAIVISHLHGDHFGGLPWCFMHAGFISRREQPLDIYGPPGIKTRVSAAMEILYPGVMQRLKSLQVRYHEILPGKPVHVRGADVTAIEVEHDSGAPSYGLRFASQGKVFAYTGDSQWTPSLIDIGRAADLYLMECCWWSGARPMHLSWEQIAANIGSFGAKRLLLTHMSHEMLARQGDVKDPRVSFAHDGLRVDI